MFDQFATSPVMRRFTNLSKNHPTLLRRSLIQFRSSSTKGSNTLQKDLNAATSKPLQSNLAKSPAEARQASRIDRLISRSPRFLHKHLQSLRSAPLTHITAFLILHELTAVIPLFGLAGAFHYYHWLPPYFAEGAWVVAGVEKFGRYARRKGWITVSDEQEAEREARSGDASKIEKDSLQSKTVKGSTTGKWFGKGESGVRWVVEFGTAYAIVKAFLIPRLFVSAWAAPWFARWSVIPIVNLFKGFRARAPSSSV